MKLESPGRTQAKRRLFAFIALLTLGACATPPNGGSEGVVRTSSAAIQGGSADSTHTFVVAVIDSSHGTCSGTLIAPNLVVTARHCISSYSGGATVDCAVDEFTVLDDPAKYRVSTATSASYDTSPYDVAKFLVPKTAKACGNDIALLVLASKIPQSEASPATPALDPKSADYGKTLTAIGYGASSPTAKDVGDRRSRDGIPIVCMAGDGSGCDPATYTMAAAEIAAGDGLCGGDSGSGAFVSATVGTTPEIFGVMSRARVIGASCTDAVYTRTDAFADFLVAGALEAATAGSYAPPQWAKAVEAPDAAPSPAPSADSDAAPSPSAPAPKAEDTEAPSQAAVDTGCAIASPTTRTSGRTAGLSCGLALVVAGTLLRRRRSYEMKRG